MGVIGEPIRDEPDLYAEPEWNTTAWAYPDAGLAISFYALTGEQFFGNYRVDAVLVVGRPKTSFAFFAHDEPTLQRSFLLPLEDLKWGDSERHLSSILGPPYKRNGTTLIYRFDELNYVMEFEFEHDALQSSIIQLMNYL